MEALEDLVDNSLEVIFRRTFPDSESAKLGRGEKIQVLVRHPHDSSKTYAVLGKDVRDALKKTQGVLF